MTTNVRRATRPARCSLACLAWWVAACGGSDPIQPPEPSECPGLSSGQLSLGLGESCLLRGSDAAAFDLAAASAARDYLIVVQSASQVAGAMTSVRFSARGPGDSPTASTARLTPVDGEPSVPDPSAVASAGELRLKQNALRELRRVGARVHRGRPRGQRGGAAVQRGEADGGNAVRAASVRVGDTVTVSNSVGNGLSVSCDSENTVTAVVQAEGERLRLLEDVEVAGAFDPTDWAELIAELDQLVYPVDSAYFGEPADIDDNGRVLALFTADVNRLTDRGSSTIILGFFNPSDLSDQETCPASNQGEVLYLVAPDPTGRFSDPVSVGFAKSVARGVTAHELQHLITAEQRVILGTGNIFFDLEEPWLSEGFAHTAESVAGLHVAGLSTRMNLTLSQLVTTGQPSVTFTAYHRANFRRLGQNLFDPGGTLALGNANGSDPGGVSSLEMRGFAWNFLRWLADHYAPSTPVGIVPGSGEQLLFRELSTGGPDHLAGIENVLRAVQVVSGQTRTWEQLLAEYAAAPALDDNGPPQLNPRTQIPTWQLRDIYGGLNEGFPDEPPFTRVYPLGPNLITLADFTNTSFDFDLGASAARYFVLKGEGPPAVGIEVTTPTGAPLPASAAPQVAIVRTR